MVQPVTTIQAQPWYWTHYASLDSTNWEATRILHDTHESAEKTVTERGTERWADESAQVLHVPAADYSSFDFSELAYPRLVSIISADEQTHGRGRLQREWVSDNHAGMYASFTCVMSQDFYRTNGTWLSTIAGLCACDAVRTVCGIDAQLKWPNDVYVEGKKLGGILCETVMSPEITAQAHGVRNQYTRLDDTIVAVVMGIGINVTAAPELTGQSYEATSIAQIAQIAQNAQNIQNASHGGAQFSDSQLSNALQSSPETVIRALIAHIGEKLTSTFEAFEPVWADIYKAAESNHVLPRFSSDNAAARAIRTDAQEHSATLGKRVQAELADGKIIRGTAVDIALDAALNIRPDNSSTPIHITVGDVTHLR